LEKFTIRVPLYAIAEFVPPDTSRIRGAVLSEPIFYQKVADN
jgi:hypothetical protein